MVEVGAGKGILTSELSRIARRVLAVELDPALARTLITRFAKDGRVLVVAGDILDVPFPAQPFRVFGNIPFGSTTRILRHLLDSAETGLFRADLVVARGVAIKRTMRPGNLLNVCWGPWWEFEQGRRIAARSFTPAPSTDAALLTIVRRRTPHLPAHEMLTFAGFVRSAFGFSTVRTAMRQFLSPRRIRVLSSELHLSPDAQPRDVTLDQWVSLYRASRTEQHRRVKAGNG